jgi:hypothetical protein
LFELIVWQHDVSITQHRHSSHTLGGCHCGLHFRGPSVSIVAERECKFHPSFALPASILAANFNFTQATLSRWRNKHGRAIVPIEPLRNFDWRAEKPKRLRPFKPTYNITMGTFEGNGPEKANAADQILSK